MNYFRRVLERNRDFIMKEVIEVKGLLHLLMKYRHEGKPWTGAEKQEIRMHLRNISKVVPVVTIFLLPGGSLLLPFLVDVLDRGES